MNPTLTATYTTEGPCRREAAINSAVNTADRHVTSAAQPPRTIFWRVESTRLRQDGSWVVNLAAFRRKGPDS